jgi:predicted GNAT family acetyltransferase
MSEKVIYNPERYRYEMAVGDYFVHARTHLKSTDQGEILYIDYVEAAPELRGSGAAGRFMAGLMEIARAEGLKVIPFCSYAASWLKRHNEYDGLMAKF